MARGALEMKDAAFVQAILANPNDEANRLVYADWLDDQSDSRGEYLRLDVALLDTPPLTTKYRELRDRFLALRAGIDSTWARSVSFRRITSIEGLVHYLREFHRSWSVSPSLDSAIIPEDLPYGLSLLYREFGALIDLEGSRTPFGTQDGLVSAHSLRRINKMVEFAWENQSNWSCRCPVEEKDPPVYSNAADAWDRPKKGFQKVCDSLNHFLITLALHEAVFSSPFKLAFHQTSPAEILNVPCRPLWLAGKYVHDDPLDFFAVPEEDVILMEEGPWWVGSHSEALRDVLKKGVKPV